MYRYFVLLVFIFISIQGFRIWNEGSAVEGTAEKYIPPPQHINHLAFGYRESFADSLWIRAIQDLDTCQKKTGYSEQVVAEVELREEAKKADPELSRIVQTVNQANKGRTTCQRGWVYRMLDAVTELAPRFRMPYSLGAVSLSVLIDDYEGASALYEKAFKTFPEDWVILYRASYHYMFDKKDFTRAAELMTRASAIEGAPYWLQSLAARLYTNAGQAELALSNLLAVRERVQDNPVAVEMIDERIRRIREVLLQEDGGAE